MVAKVFPNIAFLLKNEGEQDFSKLLSSQTGIRILEKDRPELPIDYHGHGVRRQFILSAYRSLSDKFELLKKKSVKKDEDFAIQANSGKAKAKTSMLLYEEPELYLHPDPIRAVKDLIYVLAADSEFQVMAATHAPIMIDLSKPHTTLVRMSIEDKTGSRLVQISDDIFNDEDRERLKMLTRFDPHVCEAFFADRVVLVEGDTEKVVIMTLIERLKVEKAIGPSDFVHVVNCGSKMNIPFFQKVLRHFRIPYVVLHDIDTRRTSTRKANPAWTMNQRIWDEIVEARKTIPSCRRYVFVPEFETAHGYSCDEEDGKPFSAYKQAKEWDLTAVKAPALAYLLAVIGQNPINEEHDQTFVDGLAKD
jgi:hypothetical protein